MYLGPFYFDIREILLLIFGAVIAAALYFGFNIYTFSTKALFTLFLLILITKGLLPAVHNDAFFILTLVSVFLLLYLPLFQVILFYFISFFLFRLFKII